MIVRDHRDAQVRVKLVLARRREPALLEGGTDYRTRQRDPVKLAGHRGEHLVDHVDTGGGRVHSRVLEPVADACQPDGQFLRRDLSQYLI